MNNLLWNLKAKLYHAIRTSFLVDFILKRENSELEFILRSLDINGKTVLDLGTGTGNVLQYLTNSKLVIAIDFARSMLRIVRQTCPQAKLLQAEAIALPIATNSVELVTAIGLSEYLWQIESFFDEVFRILKNNGFLVLTFSPPGIWTQLRLLLGHQIYSRTQEDLITIARKKQFQIMKTSRSLMQGQVLFQKI
jgi:ubiquinone/menaquinone biosynthesis C-methylase UbiE